MPTNKALINKCFTCKFMKFYIKKLSTEPAPVFDCTFKAKNKAKLTDNRTKNKHTHTHTHIYTYTYM